MSVGMPGGGVGWWCVGWHAGGSRLVVCRLACWGGGRLVVCRLACWSACWRQEPHQARTDIAARCLTLPVPCPLQLAAAAGVPVVLDAGGATDPLSPGLLRCLAVISPNETELQGLTGGFGGACHAVLVCQHRCLLYRSQRPAQRRVHLAHMRACTLRACTLRACTLSPVLSRHAH